MSLPKQQVINRRKMGSCDNCLGPFVIPNNVSKGKKKKRFCSENCRKQFWMNKGLSVHKLEVQVRKWVRDELKAAGIQIQGRVA